MGRHVEVIDFPISQADTPKKALDAALDWHSNEYGISQYPDVDGSVTVAPRFSNEQIDSDELVRSRGNAAVITPIISAQSTVTRTVKKTLIFTGEEWGNNVHSNYSVFETRNNRINDALKQQIALRDGEQIIRFQADIGENSGTYSPNRGDQDWVKRKSKVVSRATEGKAVTRYVIFFDHQYATQPKNHETLWKEGYASQAEARKAMNAIMDESERIDSAEIMSFTRREDGSPLVVSKREVSKVTVYVKVEIAKSKPNPDIRGYEVAFLVKT